MPLSETGSYTNQIPRNNISMPTSQTWSYMRTHIENPIS
ncbi:hypothetical protein F383_23210 [Gossypium arboreum]|uniref:Uncharacterized protein n=1 Tax=Gossypium arboreum TaxID=29729 RepID=A0A0B0MU79_GOSAR|nr:hypothetical protein F383_25393 [Gossypium arboreum]KHG18105.1 hypothetical protein F383_23209 [Gossypium arboreum]KHG18106.1 hypothetical protein F383_23210 [Gossypium arboreum]